VPPKIKVLIATTAGPVEIESIHDETPDLGGSVACVAGGTATAGFDHDYRAFVAPRTGIVARLFGNDCFRLDVSNQIDTGSSWQLPVLLAHALHSTGQLAHKDERAAAVFAATGTVRVVDQSIVAVGFVNEKLRLSLDVLRHEKALGRKLTVVWPKANSTDVDDVLREELLDLDASILEPDQVTSLLSALQMPVKTRTARPLPSAQPVWPGSPFRGLRPFELEHRRVFFGRGRAREEAVARLKVAAARNCAFLLIHGRSGAGKSSLARAGLLGDLAMAAGQTIAWRTAILDPGHGGLPPLAALSGALLGVLPELDSTPERFEALVRECPADAINAIVRTLTSPPGKICRLVLLVDQLETLFFWARERKSLEAAAERDRFSEFLGRLARCGCVWVIATLRSDLLALLDDSPSLSRLATDHRLYRLERPTRLELGEIVQGPSGVADLTFAGTNAAGVSLVEVLVDAAAAAPDSLPLLQFLLAQLYELVGDDGEINYEMYERLGGIEGAIGQQAEQITDALGEGAEITEATDDVLLLLGRRDPESGMLISRAALLESDFLTGVRAKVIEALEKGRLIIIDNARDQVTARVAHNALLTHWDRARQIFELHDRALTLRDQLEAGARKWIEEGCDQAYLLSPGNPLERALDIAKLKRVHLSASAREFISAASQRASRLAARERGLRRGKAAAAAAVALVSIAALVNWRRAQSRLDAAIDAISILVETASNTVRPIAQLNQTEAIIKRANQAIDLADNDRLILLRARSLLILAGIELDRGHIDEVRRRAGDALTLLRGRETDAGFRLERARCRHLIGVADDRENKYNDAVAAYREAISGLSKIVDGGTVSEANWYAARSLAKVYHDLGDVYLFRLGQSGDALIAFKKYKELSLKLLSAIARSKDLSDYESEIKHDIAWADNKFGDVAVSQRSDSDAMTHFLEARDRLEALGDYTWNPLLWSHHLALVFNNIGLIHFRSGEYSKAIDFYLKAENLLEQVIKRDPGNTLTRGALIWTHGNRGKSVFYEAIANVMSGSSQSHELSREALEAARDILQRAIVDNSALETMTPQQLGWRIPFPLLQAYRLAATAALDQAAGDNESAASGFLEAGRLIKEDYMALFGNISRPEHPEAHALGADLFVWRAAALHTAGHKAEALAACEQAVQMARDAFPGGLAKTRERVRSICPEAVSEQGARLP
jgi:tetratricopeptide (TPR) repeat protein